MRSMILAVGIAILLAFPQSVATAAGPPDSTDVFVEHTGGYFAYRIPAIETSPDGSLLAFAEARKYDRGDPGYKDQDIDLVYRRSSDGGKTWSLMKVIEDPGRALVCREPGHGARSQERAGLAVLYPLQAGPQRGHRAPRHRRHPGTGTNQR